MPSISTKGRQMPPSPIRKLVPFAEAAKQRWTINVGVNKLTAPQLKVTVTGEDGVTTETETFTFTEQ